MVPQHIIDEAKARGIVPGVTVQWKEKPAFVVPPYDKWNNMGGNVAWMSRDGAPHEHCWIYGGFSYMPTVITPAPQAAPEGLVEGDACECGPAMRAAIVELAKELGIWHADGLDQHGDDEVVGLWFVTDVKRVYWSCKMWSSNVLHAPEAFIAKMRVEAAKPKPIRINGLDVKHLAGFIQFGDTTIDNATVRTIAANLKD